MTFPANNLPTASRTWAREVEKKVTNLESSFRSAEVNNVTRDSQLSVTANTALSVANVAQQAAEDAASAAAQAQSAAALAQSAADTANAVASTANNAAAQAQAAADTANAAIAGLGSLDEPTSTYKLNASNLVAGTINASVIAVENINASNITTGSLSADRISGGTISGVGNITSGGTIFATVNLGCGENIGVNGNAIVGSDLTVGSTSVNGAITRAFLSGGGTTGASFTNSGSLVRTSSSRRYKTEIQPLELDLEDLYNTEPKTFKRIDEVEEDPESARVYPGFIAEELAGTSLDKFVFYSKDEDGNLRPEGIHYPELTAALLMAIKDLNARLEALESR